MTTIVKKIWEVTKSIVVRCSYVSRLSPNRQYVPCLHSPALHIYLFLYFGLLTFNALMSIILCYIFQIWYIHWAAYFVAEKSSENVNWTFYWWNVICISSKRNDRKTKGGVIRVFVLFLLPATWQSSLVSQTSFLSCAPPPLDQT